ncbi:MAG: hypothetical protein WCP11_01300 [Candidatus Saccharibacteria bacterium]
MKDEALKKTDLFDLNHLGTDSVAVLKFLLEKANKYGRHVIGISSGLIIEVFPESGTDVKQSERLDYIYSFALDFTSDDRLLLIPSSYENVEYLSGLAILLSRELKSNITIGVAAHESPIKSGDRPILDNLSKELRGGEKLKYAVDCILIVDEYNIDEDSVPIEEEYDANEETMRELEEMGALLSFFISTLLVEVA